MNLNFRQRDTLLAEIGYIFNSDENITKHIQTKTISVYSNYFLGNDFSQIFSDEIQEKLIYILSSELFFNQTILPKIEEIISIFQQEIDSTRSHRKKLELLINQNRKLYELYQTIKNEDDKLLISDSTFVKDYINLYFNDFYDKSPVYNEIISDVEKLKSYSNKIDPREVSHQINQMDYLANIKILTKICLLKINSSYIKTNFSLIENRQLNYENGFPILGGLLKKQVEKKEDSLYTIWQSKDTGYLDEILKILQMKVHFHISFVTKIDGKIKWNEVGNFAQYLAGFFYILHKKKWVDIYSAPQIAKILSKTFNRDKPYDSKAFRNISIFDKVDYLKPFSFIKENEN
jgi:hypothetical protein